MHGPAAIQAGMTEAFKDPNFSLTFAADKVEIAAGGDMAYTQGHFTETETSPGAQAKLVQSGSYVTVYKKQADGSWKAVADIASNGPPSGAPKAAN
jgi:ketosteroid isomerase-like protein